MFQLGIFLIFIGLLYFLYQKIPNKTVFFSFCLVMAITAGIAAYSVYHPHSNDAEANRIARERIIAQQQIFSEWYAIYQKRISSLDYNWQQYHSIIISLKNDDINQDEAFERLVQLEEDAGELSNVIKNMTPPAALNDENYDLTNKIYHKTLDYAEAQLNTITLTKEAAKPAEPQPAETAEPEAEPEADKAMPQLSKPDSKEKKKPVTLPQKLEKIMLVNAPAGLFNAKEISALRENLTLPEEKNSSSEKSTLQPKEQI